MADDITPVAGDKTPVVTPAPTSKRKYTYLGKIIKDPKVYNRYGTLKIRPWSMTDAEIDKCLAIRPDLARLWKVS